MDSKAFDWQGIVLLAALQFDRADRRGLTLSLQSMKRMVSSAPNSARLRRFGATVGVLKAVSDGQASDAAHLVASLLKEVQYPDFDFEAACNLLMTLGRMGAHEAQLPDIADHVRTLSARFAVSRTTTDLLCAALRGHGSLDVVIKEEAQQLPSCRSPQCLTHSRGARVTR